MSSQEQTRERKTELNEPKRGRSAGFRSGDLTVVEAYLFGRALITAALMPEVLKELARVESAGASVDLAFAEALSAWLSGSTVIHRRSTESDSPMLPAVEYRGWSFGRGTTQSIRALNRISVVVSTVERARTYCEARRDPFRQSQIVRALRIVLGEPRYWGL